MEHLQLPDWEKTLVDEAIEIAERRLELEKRTARRRAVQLAREQAYHRLAVAIDRPSRGRPGDGQLRLFPLDDTLFE